MPLFRGVSLSRCMCSLVCIVHLLYVCILSSYACPPLTGVVPCVRFIQYVLDSVMSLVRGIMTLFRGVSLSRCMYSLVCIPLLLYVCMPSPCMYVLLLWVWSHVSALSNMFIVLAGSVQCPCDRAGRVSSRFRRHDFLSANPQQLVRHPYCQPVTYRCRTAVANPLPDSDALCGSPRVFIADLSYLR